MVFRERVASGRDEELVTTAVAYVFVVGLPVDERHEFMASEEARENMPDMDELVISLERLTPAAEA